MLLVNKHLYFACFIIIISATLAFSQNKEQEKPTESIMIQKDKRTDLQKLKGEEINVYQEEEKTYLPGSKENQTYSPEQDSLYFRAMRTKMTGSTRFAMELMETSKENAFVESISNTEWSIAMKNLAMIPQSYYAPLGVDVVNHEIGIQNAFYVPGVPTLPKLGTAQIPLSTIGRVLGIIEDVTPVFRYEVVNASDVEVVVYSMQAIVLQTMFKGYQQKGSYTLTWNLRDSKGKLMPRGDYVIEARIGKKIIKQKKVVIS